MSEPQIAEAVQAEPKKKILIVMEGPEGYPFPASRHWVSDFTRKGYEVTACGKIVEAFSELGFDDVKYDLVILDPLNDQIMYHGQMAGPDKIAALGVLARAKKNGAQTICTIDSGITKNCYDMKALTANADRRVEHGNYEEMDQAVKEMLADSPAKTIG